MRRRSRAQTKTHGSGVLQDVRLDLANIQLRGFFSSDYQRVLGAVTLLTGSRPAAEDAVHEALARAWERSLKTEHDSIEHLDRWVLTVALNVARSRWRKLRRETLQRDVAAIPEAYANDSMSMDLRQAIRDLPDRQREVIVLHYVIDMSVEEVADLLGLSPGGVKHALFRARHSLANVITKEEVV